MANADKQRTLTLLAKVDEQTIKRSIQHFRELREAEQGVVSGQDTLDQSNDQVADSLGAVNSETARNVSEVQRRLALARQDAAATMRQVDALKDEKKAREDVADAADRQAAATKDAAAGGAGGPAASPLGKHGLRSISSGSSALAGLDSLAGAGPAGGLLRGVSNLARLTQSIEQFSGAAEGAAGAAGEAGTGLAAVGGGLASLAAAGAAGIALIALNLAIQKFTKDIQEAQARLDDAFSAQEEYYRAVKTGTSESIKAQLEQLAVDKYVNEQLIKDAQRASEGLTGFQKVLYDIGTFLGMGPAKNIEEWNKELEKNQFETTALNNALNSQEVKQRDAAEAAKTQALEQQKASSEVQKTTEATKQATTAEQARSQAIDQTTQALSRSQQIVANYQNYTNQRAEVAANYAKQFADLEARRQQILADGADEQKKIAEDTRRDQEKAARELAFSIAKILARSTLDQFESLLTLDFAGAARTRRQTAFDIAQEKAQFRFDSQERLLAAQQRMEEARTQVAKQLVQLEQQRAEIVAAQAKALVDLFNKLLQAQVQVARTAPGASFGHKAPGFASGGPINAYQTGIVQEGYRGQRESFNSGGRRYEFPDGAGLFMPLKSGNIAQSSRGEGIQVTVDMRGMILNDRREMARIAGQKTEEMINTITNGGSPSR